MADDRAMQILLIEDTASATTTLVATLSPYGKVHAARSLDEARAVMDSGARIDAVITDLHLRDGRSWQETVADVVTLARGRPIAAHTADLYLELRQEFARLFSGRVDLFSKRDDRGLVAWASQFRENEAGRMVQTMDRGSAQSHSDIRAELIEWAHDLGFPKPVEYELRKLIECWVTWRQRWATASDIVAKTLLGLLVTGVATILVSALWNAKW